MHINGKEFRTIWFENNIVKIIDQTKLPHQFIIKDLKTIKDSINAIKTMEVRGAPLIGATAVGSWFSFDWSRRESLFLLRVLACAFLTGIPAAFALSIPNVGIPIAILLAIILITRLSLIFPATAMNHQTSISQAWQMSRRHQIPLFGIVVLFPLIFVLLPAWLLSQLPYATILSSLLSMVGTIFTLAAVSLAYREVIRIDKIQSVSIT